MGDPATHIFTRDLGTAREFLKECLRAEQRKAGSQVTDQLVMLVVSHTERVCMWTEILCGSQKIVEPQYALMGAILHDCAKLWHNSPGGLQTNELHIMAGKKLVFKFLSEELGKDKQLAQDVALMVGSHNFGMHQNPKLDAPEKLLEKIVHDANLLDYTDVWGLLLTAEYSFRRKTGGAQWDLQTTLEWGASQALRLKGELTLDIAKSIAGTPQEKGILRRLTRGMKYFCGLNLKTIEDLRHAFNQFLRAENTKP